MKQVVLHSVIVISSEIIAELFNVWCDRGVAFSALSRKNHRF